MYKVIIIFHLRTHNVAIYFDVTKTTQPMEVPCHCVTRELSMCILLLGMHVEMPQHELNSLSLTSGVGSRNPLSTSSKTYINTKMTVQIIHVNYKNRPT